MQYVEYYLSLPQSRFTQSQNDCLTQFYVMQRISQIAEIVDENLAKKMDQQLNSYGATYTSRGGQLQ